MYQDYINEDLTSYYASILNCSIKEIISYALQDGKCIRGFIVKHTIETLTNKPTKLWQPTVCVELVHGFSLVIDDLPCMDNDLIRRNKPSTFVKFGERASLLTSMYGISQAFHLLFDGLNQLEISQENYIYFTIISYFL